MHFTQLLRPRAGAQGPALVFAWFCGVFLLLQGASTLLARLVPAVDQAIPSLLRATRMVPAHSLLHIFTALLAFLVLAAGARPTLWFAALFGAFYAGIGILGMASGADNPNSLCGLPAGLGLQPFDHPFHILLGLMGVSAAWRTHRLEGAEASVGAARQPGRSEP